VLEQHRGAPRGGRFVISRLVRCGEELTFDDVTLDDDTIDEEADDFRRP
jgi:hypothetical protein